MTFPQISSEAWDAAMMIDEALDGFLGDHGIERKEKGSTRIAAKIAQIVQLSIDRAKGDPLVLAAWELAQKQWKRGQQ